MQRQDLKEQAKMLILANQEQHYQLLVKLLKHYFPGGSQQYLQLSTKYYQADIKIHHRIWPLLQDIQKQKQVIDKQDLMVMIATPQQSHPPQLYDSLIQKHNPDNFLLILCTQNPQQPWKEEQVISQQVNNFIEIVKQNLNEVVANPPERKTQGLLNDHYQDGSIFNLIQLMQTTQWSKIQQVGGIKNKKEQKDIEQKVQEKKQQTKSQQKLHSDKQPDPQKECEEPQLTEEQLQQQMACFQSMLGQISSLKAMQTQPQTTEHKARKQKAQNILTQLLSGMPL